MTNSKHPGETIREIMDRAGWSITQTAARLGCGSGTLSRLLNGRISVSANMALALEDIGWETASHWLQMQASCNLSEVQRTRAAAEPKPAKAPRVHVVLSSSVLQQIDEAVAGEAAHFAQSGDIDTSRPPNRSTWIRQAIIQRLGRERRRGPANLKADPAGS